MNTDDLNQFVNQFIIASKVIVDHWGELDSSHDPILTMCDEIRSRAIFEEIERNKLHERMEQSYQ